MELNFLTAISPLDGRYRQKVDELDLYFSEFGLIRYRLMVEIEYFIALCDIPLPQLTDFKKDEKNETYQYISTAGEKRFHYWFIACKYKGDEVVACKTFTAKQDLP